MSGSEQQQRQTHHRNYREDDYDSSGSESSRSSRSREERDLIVVARRGGGQQHDDGSLEEEEEEHEDRIRDVTLPLPEVRVPMSEPGSSFEEVSREFTDYSKGQGLIDTPEQVRKRAMAVAGQMFRYKKFITNERELDYGGEICKKISEKMGMAGMSEEGKREWWGMVKQSVRIKINKKRSAASQKIRENFMSKCKKDGEEYTGDVGK